MYLFTIYNAKQNLQFEEKRELNIIMLHLNISLNVILFFKRVDDIVSTSTVKH